MGYVKVCACVLGKQGDELRVHEEKILKMIFGLLLREGELSSHLPFFFVSILIPKADGTDEVFQAVQLFMYSVNKYQNDPESRTGENLLVS